MFLVLYAIEKTFYSFSQFNNSTLYNQRKKTLLDKYSYFIKTFTSPKPITKNYKPISYYYSRRLKNSVIDITSVRWSSSFKISQTSSFRTRYRFFRDTRLISRLSFKRFFHYFRLFPLKFLYVQRFRSKNTSNKKTLSRSYLKRLALFWGSKPSSTVFPLAPRLRFLSLTHFFFRSTVIYPRYGKISGMYYFSKGKSLFSKSHKKTNNFGRNHYGLLRLRNQFSRTKNYYWLVRQLGQVLDSAKFYRHRTSKFKLRRRYVSRYRLNIFRFKWRTRRYYQFCRRLLRFHRRFRRYHLHGLKFKYLSTNRRYLYRRRLYNYQFPYPRKRNRLPSNDRKLTTIRFYRRRPRRRRFYPFSRSSRESRFRFRVNKIAKKLFYRRRRFSFSRTFQQDLYTCVHRFFNLLSAFPNRRRFNFYRSINFYFKKQKMSFTGLFFLLFTILGVKNKKRGAVNIKIPALIKTSKVLTLVRHWLKKGVQSRPDRCYWDRVLNELIYPVNAFRIRNNLTKSAMVNRAFL